MTVSIRSLSSNDYESWLEMWKGYQEFYEVTLPDDVTECLWHRLLSKNPDGPICYVAEDDRLVNRARSVSLSWNDMVPKKEDLLARSLYETRIPRIRCRPGAH